MPTFRQIAQPNPCFAEGFKEEAELILDHRPSVMREVSVPKELIWDRQSLECIWALFQANFPSLPPLPTFFRRP